MRLVQTPSRVLVHGHRGARALYPENTIPAFTYAIEAGADAIELDVLATRDNVLVVTHDPHINPAICTGPHPGVAIRELTWADLRQHDCGALPNEQFPRQQPVPGTRIPALSEVLDLSRRGAFQFDIEIKSFPERPEWTPPPDVFARMVLDEIRNREVEERVVVQSFDFRTLHAMKRLAPWIRLAALWSAGSEAFAGIALSAQAAIVSPQFELVTVQQVRAAHAAGLTVVPWTANTAEDWERLVDAQVDGIITDDPAALIAYLQAKLLR